MNKKLAIRIVWTIIITALWVSCAGVSGKTIEEDQLPMFERGIALDLTTAQKSSEHESDAGFWEFSSTDSETIGTDFTQRTFTWKDMGDHKYRLLYQGRDKKGKNVGNPVEVYLVATQLSNNGESFYAWEKGVSVIQTANVDSTKRILVSVKVFDKEQSISDVWVPVESLAQPTAQQNTQSNDTETPPAESESGEALATVSLAPSPTPPSLVEEDTITITIPKDKLSKFKKSKSAKVILSMEYDKTWEESDETERQYLSSSFRGLETGTNLGITGYVLLMIAVIISIGINVYLILKRRG